MREKIAKLWSELNNTPCGSCADSEHCGKVGKIIDNDAIARNNLGIKWR